MSLIRIIRRWLRRRRQETDEPAKAQLSNAAFSLSAVELHRLISAAGTLRDRALVRLLAETGMRRAEAAALRWADIDLAAQLLVVRRGKGKKLRMIPIRQELLADLSAMMQTHDSAFVFPSRQRDRLSTRQINRIVVNVAQRAGVRSPNPAHRQVTCHQFRHSFARLWKSAGGSIESLSTILGHASVKTTWDVYGTESLADIQRNYDQTTTRMYRSKDPVAMHSGPRKIRKR